MPLGTGNDRIKTYKTPNNVQKTIQIIRNKNTVYFNNVAGIGYDAYVVNNLKKLKRLGSIAYLLSGLKGIISYKKKAFKITVNNTIIETKFLMTVFGIGKYSGGDIQFTNYQDASNGLLNITVVKNMTFLNLLINIHKLYNGMLITHKEVSIFSSKQIKVVPNFSKRKTYIQADGEIIGTGEVKVSIHKQAIQFVVP